MSHQTFGPTFNMREILEKKSTLNKVTQTTFTRIDGSKYTVNNQDGSRIELSKESTDETGSWAVLDEAGALLLSSEDKESEVQHVSSTVESDNAVLVDLLKAYPQLSQYLILIKVGVPATSIRKKIFTEGVADSLPKGVAKAFCDAIGASKDLPLQCQPSQLVGSPMKGDHSELHGHLGDISWAPPVLASFSDAPARAGYNTEKGHEYLDTPQVLKSKVKLLASMLLEADKPVFYAGAGLSTASGIGDYATQTGSSGVLASRGQRGSNISPFCVSPNFGHHTIAALAKKGLVHRFVQQNHDGLPQKAGMSQGMINEIHGGWFDPSNPVVAMSGGLREDLFADLLQVEQETDLVIAVGSSLCGMNADRLVTTSARKARAYREAAAKQNTFDSSSNSAAVLIQKMFSKKSPSKDKKQFGSVIISIQKTVHDHNSSLRIFALIDDVFKLLAEELQLDMTHLSDLHSSSAAAAAASNSPPLVGDSDDDQRVFEVPYDHAGTRLDRESAATQLMKLDLSDGAELVITRGPDKGAKAVVLGKNKDGHYRVSVDRMFKHGSQRAFTETRLLGSWWPQNAMNAEVEYIPVVNR